MGLFLPSIRNNERVVPLFNLNVQLPAAVLMVQPKMGSVVL